MAKTIALNLTINGVKQSITNINQLEEAIKNAEEQLKGVEIGSEQFKKLSTELKTAKNLAEDFSESIKGQDLEKRVGAFAKVGSAVTSSFAGAQAAISLFGNESEAVAEAAAKAQSVLTIALTAREVAEGAVAVKTVAANIATYASVAANNAANLATKALWTTLAANPYGAIIAAVGLVITALMTLTSETEEQINVQKELSAVTSDEANKLKQQLTILTQLGKFRNLQLKTIEDLKKEYPGFNTFLTKENKLNEDGIEFIKAKIKQYELEAKAKLIIQKMIENELKISQLQTQVNIDNVTFYQQLKNAFLTGGNAIAMVQKNIQTALENSQVEVQKLQKDNNLLEGSLQSLYKEMDSNLGVLNGYNERLEAQAVAEENAADAKRTAIEQLKAEREAYKNGLNAIQQFGSEIDKLTQLQKSYTDSIKQFAKTDFVPKIIKDLEALKTQRDDAIKSLKQYEKDYLISIKAIQQPLPEDKFLSVFGTYRATLEDIFVSGPRDFKETFDNFFKDFITKNKDLTQAQINALFNLKEQYKAVEGFIRDTDIRQFVDDFTGLDVAFDDININIREAEKGAKAFLNITGDIASAAGAFKLEFQRASGIGDVTEILLDPQKAAKNAKLVETEIEKFLFVPTAERAVKLRLQVLEQIKEGLTGTQDPKELVRLKEIEGQLQSLALVYSRIAKEGEIAFDKQPELLKKVNDIVKGNIETFKQLLVTTVEAEQAVLAVNLEVQRLTQELSDQTQEGATKLSQAIGGLLLQNIEGITTRILGVRNKAEKEEQAFIEKVKADTKGLNDFIAALEKKGLDLSKANRSDLLAAFIEFKRKEVEVNKEAEEDKRKETEKTLTLIGQSFQIFSQTLNQISSVTRERTQTDLDSLKIAQETALDNVVGNSETAAKKRIEIETEFQKKREEIEKKAAVQSLQLSLVQSIAQAAQAIVNILQSTAVFGPAAPFVAAGLIGVTTALTAAQIAIISDQIANAQMMRRGGLLKAQSGMLLQGPSHEQGGIPLAQYGVVAEGNEAIINRQSSVNFRDLLSSINQSGGGRPLVVNNFDDSRIVEALAKQNQKPIRAYVLESEITNEQTISKRLDDLSKF